MTSSGTAARFPYFLGIGLLVALLATTALYWQGLNGPYLVDDDASISTAQVDEFSFSPVWQTVLSNTTGPAGRPVSVFSFILTDYFHGAENPFWYKYQNLMLHLLNGLLLFWLLGRILPRLSGGAVSPNRAWIMVGAATFIWLVHPLLVSTVLYVVQRMAQLATLFTILSILSYVFGREAGLQGRPWRAVAAFAGSALAMVLAVLSKENGALAPVFLLLVEAFVFRFAGLRARSVGTGGFLLLSALPLLAGGLLFLLFSERFIGGYEAREFTLGDRLITQIGVVWLYIKMTLLPMLRDMTLFHDAHPIQSAMDWRSWLGLAGIGGLVAAVFIGWRRAPVLGFGVGWFLAAHLMESTVLPLEMVFEHRNYLAAAGLLLPFGYYLLHPQTSQFLGRQRTQVVVYGLFTAILIFTAHVRVATWSNEELIYRVALESHPESSRARSGLANIVIRRGQVDEARTLLAEAIERMPENGGPRVHLLTTYCVGDEELPRELLDESLAVLANGVPSAYALSGTFGIYHAIRQGDCAAIEKETVVQLTRALTSNPRLQGAFRYYSMIHLGRALALVQRYGEATEAYQQALPSAHFAPLGHWYMAYLELFDAQLLAGDVEGALETYRQIVERNATAGAPVLPERMELLHRNVRQITGQNNEHE